MKWAVRWGCGLVSLVSGAAMADWRLQHEEDFRSARELDAAFWTVETGFIRNRESQYYQASNISVGGGALVLHARREQVPNAAFRPGGGGWQRMARFASYTSASLVSRGSFRYGRFEIVARSPSGAGMWPAIWLVHESPGQYGEIDIFEAVGKHPDTVFGAVHHGRDPRTRQHHNASRVVPGFEGSWRKHTLEWTAERIAIFLDDQLLFAYDPRKAARGEIDPLRQPMKLHINLALGGSWGGPVDDSKLPARFEIASLRIWRWAPGEAPEALGPGASAAVTEAAAPADRSREPEAPRSIARTGARGAPSTEAPASVAPTAGVPSSPLVPGPPPLADPDRGRSIRWGR